MIRFAAASLAFLMLAAPALAVEFEPNDQGFTEFNMPSGNIGCFYVPAGGTDVYKTSDGGAELSCDRVEPSYVRVMMGDSGKLNASPMWAMLPAAEATTYSSMAKSGRKDRSVASPPPRALPARGGPMAFR